MGNQSNVPQARRYQQQPIICCGDQPQRQPLDQASPNVMNVGKPLYSKFGRANSGSDKNQENAHFEQTGTTYFKENDGTIFRRPENTLQQSKFHQSRNPNYDNENTSKQSKQLNPLKPITQQQSQLKKSGFSSFKKSTYGGYNSGNPASIPPSKQTKENVKFNLDSKATKQFSTNDMVPERDFAGKQLQKQKAKVHGPFVGEGKYGGRIEEFENNKRIVLFLEDNHVKEPQFKFYDTKDNSSLMNNSTIKLAKKKGGKMEDKYLDENSTSNLKVNQNLSKLQDPIELNFQIDARIILATCILIIGIVILIIGATVIYDAVNFFVCLMIAIILYVIYIIICYVYSDVLEYFSNVRTFQQFEEDFKKLCQTHGELAYHVSLETPKNVIKQCYLLSKENKYTKIQQIQNQNRQISIDQLKDKQTLCVFIRYKTKTSFFDAQSQLNTINYFDDFLQEQKSIVQEHYGQKNQKKESRKSALRQEKQKASNIKHSDKREEHFKKALKRSDFGYELDAIDGISKKPEQIFNVCYMKQEDNGCLITMFVIFTLFGMCLPFLCFFEAYTKRYRINLLNRFRIGEGGRMGR